MTNVSAKIYYRKRRPSIWTISTTCIDSSVSRSLLKGRKRQFCVSGPTHILRIKISKCYSGPIGTFIKIEENCDWELPVTERENTPVTYTGGTLREPQILKITYGERTRNSLNFFATVGHKFYCYRLRSVNSQTLNLECANHKNSLKKRGIKKLDGCSAKAKLRVKNDIVKLIGNRRNGARKMRKLYKLDFADPRCLELSSYEILPHSSEPHESFCDKSSINSYVNRI